MSAATASPTLDRRDGRDPVPAPRAWAGPVAAGITLTITGAAGAAALVTAYRRAEWGQDGAFDWFWAGMLVFSLPAAYWAIRRGSSARLRLAVLIGYACFTYLPKLLRNPAGPLYHDEYAHWGQSHDILLDGLLFQQNPIVRVIGDYPGLHATVASLATLTGVTVWHAALFVLILAHVLLTLGVAVLAGQLWPDPRVAAAAAIVYSLNSSFLYFDTQLGYESLAIGVLVWALACAMRAIRAAGVRARLGWAALFLPFTVAITATHHLTAIWLTGMLGLIAVACTILRVPARTAWALTATAGASVALWMAAVSPRTGTYLEPYLGRSLSQFGGLAGGGSGGRTLFNQSVAPWWEQQAAFLAPGVALLAVVGAAVLWWRRRTVTDPLTRAASGAMLLLGALYFPATLLILTPSGAEGARRSWAFSYLGIAVATAPLIIALLDRARRRISGSAIFLLATCALVMVGNTAAGMNPSYRFPGPPVFGSDTRAATPELLAASAWLRETRGRGARLVADRYSGLIFGSYGEQEPTTGSESFPAYELYLAKPGSPMPPALMEQLRAWRFEYLVVDRRMAEQVPDIKIYFETNEPIPHDGRPGFTRAQLTKFDTLPWLVKVYDGPHIAIYRFDFDSQNRRIHMGAP
ncbi:hypothetical protein Aph02nite_37960 [Actinoplanes philippinensis]|uniref:4-amino-4-deoxy-L-arabinose transferase n=1 Tax=Actinoplanes philippinensis TaxID=35752 RepID=A0A1I2FJY6_9ACTN|nr:hypothetical protein [Actinoplanes philippinensis]GIE77846.1 hypothetical protein Aph02nite_37960 [Actinoplanes philippinensis]SFF05794.1 hypothetical protein SAMN05421541_105481 [Actinoplanes philippinensis]